MTSDSDETGAEQIEKPSALRGFLSAFWPYALILAVGLVVLMPKLGSFGFWDPWEPKYAETAREMIEKDSYIVPYYRHEVRLTKPILVYWGILAGSSMFGLNEFGARIIGVLMALGAMCGAYYTVFKLRGRQAGLLAALVLGTIPQFYFIGRQAMPDVYLFTSLGMCLLFFCLGLFGPDRRRDLHFMIGYACFGLALLAKGPVIIGAVFFATLAIFVAIRIDVAELWKPDRRRETVQFAAVSAATTALCGALGITAFLFGTSSLWWGYNEEGRQSMAELRLQIQHQFSTFKLAEILLLLLAAGAIAGAVVMFRQRQSFGKLFLAGAALLVLAAIEAIASLLLAGPEFRIFAASLLGTAGCILLMVIAARRFLFQPWLWPIVQPYVRPTARQCLLFIGVVLVVAGPWHIGILIKEGHGYFTDFIIKHNIQRAGETINRSGVSEFYLRVLIFGFFPWSAFIPVAIASLVSWWERNALRKYGFEIYLLIASAITFTAFTTSATKFAHYLSPIIVPMAVLIALAINRSLENRNSMASRLTWVVSLMLFLLPALDILDDEGSKYLVGAFTMKRHVPDDIAPGEFYHILLIAIGVIMALSIIVRSRVLIGGLVLAATLVANYSTGTFIPRLSAHKTMKSMAETWKAYGSGAPICFYGDLKHGIYYYTDYTVDRLTKREAFEEFMNPVEPAFCIVERATFQGLQSAYRVRYDNAMLHVADDSHFQYVLISNIPAGESAE